MPGLRLHDPEVFLFEPARQIISGAVFIGVQVSFADIVIPRGQIKVFRDFIVIVTVRTIPSYWW